MISLLIAPIHMTIYIVHSVDFPTVQSMEISVSSSRRSSTQAVSGLNSQDKIFLIVVTS
jgi:hypothetical protein